MTYNQLCHSIRALRSFQPNISIVIIGSQSIFAQLKEKSEDINSVKMSREVDIIVNNENINDQISCHLGELSQFDKTFGYFIDAVSEKIIKLPKKYKNRLVNLQIENEIIQCLNIHDYIVCKLFIGREKDLILLEELKLLNPKIINHNRLKSILTEYPESDKKMIQLATERLEHFSSNSVKSIQKNPTP